MGAGLRGSRVVKSCILYYPLQKRGFSRFTNGEGEIRPQQAARQHRHDRAHRPRQDDADGGDHEGAGEEQPEDQVPELRFDRQRAGREGARDHDRDRARGVRDAEASLRARGLPGPRRLHQEHDHRRGADGRRDSGGGGDRRADAADARAHPAGAAGGRALHRGGVEQGGRGGRSGIAGPGGAGSSRAAVEVRVSGRRDAGGAGVGAERAERRAEVGEGHRRADGCGGQLHSDAGARRPTSRS